VALFSPQQTKNDFKCDAYFIDLGKRADIVVSDTAYFFNLFSHQRDTHTWKGMVKVPLITDDASARALLWSMEEDPIGWLQFQERRASLAQCPSWDRAASALSLELKQSNSFKM
jgi:hypothetical protein